MKMRFIKKLIALLSCCSLLFLLVSCSQAKITANIEQNAENYIFDEDYQNYFSPLSSIAKTEDGYFFLSGSYLFFYDVKGQEAYPFCNKVNCDHNDSRCSAYISPLQFYMGTDIYYYDKALYMLGHEKSDNTSDSIYIYQISLENGKQRKAAYLFDSTVGVSITCILHRGYVYFANGGGEMKESEAFLCRTKLGELNSDAVEVIYSFKGIGVNIGNLNAYGNNILFNTYSYSDIQGNGYKKDTNYINIHSLETETIHNNDYSRFSVDNKIYYFKDEKNVLCYDMASKSTDMFCEINGPCYISADSNYIYFDNLQSVIVGITDKKDRKIFVYDKRGNYITSIAPKSQDDECFFGGDDIMIFKEAVAGEEIESDGSHGYYVFDKSQLTSSDKQFIDME